ncbi:hypothetical protein [Bosea sp. (in: a-proteobacteria)]|uniref:phage head spike fiber domain-containing protein n=1 Tax=Bosea sp. (in: a-proteobacteria) TaxID=1871050 RepID=UPI00262B73C4|nr:hypothetical protein [Bosea sp. (in: a-proteobacteria)]MCO5092068.1 hypothetical protein [Bosea sp. (in: a-proteobacteria)]
MAQHPIILGQYPGDKKGDPARVAGGKINQDFAELFAAVDNLSGLNLVAGPVTKLAPGANPTATLTGTAPNYTLNLGLPEGAAGAGAPNSADILAIAEKGRLERALAAAGVLDEPSLILDFIRGVHFASKGAITASIMTMITALGGVSAFSRASTGTYFDSDGLMKTAANNVPRLEYDPVSRLPRGLLMETQARTNLVTNNVSLSGIGLIDVSRTANAAASPDGTMTMSRYTSTVNGGFNTCIIDGSFTVPNDSLVRTFSGFIRQGNTPTSAINLYYTGGTFEQVVATINWSTKTISGSGNPTLDDCGGGLYWFSISLANNNSGHTAVVCRVYVRDQGSANVIGDSVDTGTWQLEVGNAKSSPIITGASAVTRAADVLTLAAGAWTSATETTLTVEFSTTVLGGILSLAEIGDGTYDNRIGTYLGGNAATIIVVSAAAVSANLSAGAYTAGSVARLVLASKLNDFAASFAAGAVGTDSSGPMPVTAATALFVGRSSGGGAGYMGHIRRLLVYPQRLSNAKLPILSGAAWS